MAKRLKNTTDLRRYVANLINRTEKGEVDPTLAGKLGYLVSLLSKLIETGDLEKRVAELESAIDSQIESNLHRLRRV